MSYTGFDDGGVGGDTTTQFGTPDYGQTDFGAGDTTTQFGTPTDDKQPDPDYANFADGGGTGTSTGHTDSTTQFGTPSNQSDQPGPTDIGTSDITTSFGTPTDNPPAPRKQQQYEIVPDVSWSPPEGTGQTEFNPGEQSGSAYVQGQDIPSDSLDYFGQAASNYYSNPTDESAAAYRGAADRKGAEIENADATDLQNFQDYSNIAGQGQQELSAKPQPAGPELQNFQDYSDIARQGRQEQGPSPSGIPADESTFTTPSGQTLARTDDGAGYGGWTIAGSDNPSNVLYNDNGNWRAVSRDEARQLQQGGAPSDQFTSVANARSIAGQAMQSTGTTPQTPGFEQRALQAGLMIAGAGLAAPAAGIATTGGEVAGPIFGSALVAPSFSAGGAAASYLFKGTGEHVGETGLFGTAPGKFVMDTISDIPLAGKYFDAIRSIPIPESAQNPWSLVTEAIQAVADDPMRLNPIVLAGDIFRNGVAGGGLKNAYNQSDATFGLQSGIQQAGPEMQSSRLIKDAGSIYGAPFAALNDALKGHFAQAALDLTHPVTGIGSFLSDVVRPVETYREIYQSELASNGGDPVKAGDAAFQRTNNGVADLLRTLDVFNPLLYSFETPLLETAVAKIFSTAGVTARNLLENVAYGAAGDVANVPARMAGLDARAVANTALRGLDLFTNLSLESGTKIALADTVRDFGTKLGRFDTPGRVGGAAADLIEAFLHRADNPSIADARIADFAKSFTGDVPTARAMSDRLGYGAQQRMLAEGVPLSDVPAKLEAYATTLRDSAFTPEQLQAARRAFTLGGSDVATVQNQTAFRLISEDLRAAAYKLAGLPIVSSGGAAQTLVDLGARTLRQMFLMPGVAALALKKIPDEFIRGVTQGVWGVSPADLQLVRTAALRLSESRNPALARFGNELQSRSVIRQMLADGVPIDSQLVRGDVNRVGIQHFFAKPGSSDNLGRPLTFASRLEALAGSPSRLGDKILEIGASSPTSHVRLNAARQSLNEGAGVRGQWLDDTLRGMSRYGVSERDLTAARRAFFDAHPEDVFAAANLSESMGAASPRVPAAGMAKGTPISPRVAASIEQTGGSHGLVRAVIEGHTAPTMDEVAATLKSAPGPDVPAPKPARASEWADTVRAGKVEPVMVPRDVRDSAEAMGVRYDPAETPKQFADRIAAAGDGATADGTTVRTFPGRSFGGEMDLAAGGMGRVSPQFRDIRDDMNAAGGFGSGRTLGKDSPRSGQKMTPEMRGQSNFTLDNLRAQAANLPDGMPLKLTSPEKFARQLDDAGDDAGKLQRVYDRIVGTQIAVNRFAKEELAAPHAEQIESYLEDLARVRQPKDGTYSTDRARRVLSDRAAQDEQWRYGEAAGTREAPFSRDGSVPRRTDTAASTPLLPEGERYVGKPSPSDLRYALRPDDMTLAGNGGVMLSDEAARARRLAAESRAGTRQYLAQRDLDTQAQMRERYAPARIGGTADGRGVPPPSPIYRPTYDPAFEPRLGPATVPDFQGLADYLRGQGRQLDQILQGRAAGAVERGNSIIGNFREQTPIGELLSRGTINGSSPLHLGSFQLPVLPALPFAAFHVHTTQFWADYFLTHPAVPFAVARALNAYHVDEYGGVQTPDGYVSGVTNPSTAAHLVQWAMDLYRYARDVRNSPNGNSIIQQAAKVVGAGLFGNDAYVRPFDYYSTPAQAVLQSTTNPLLTPKGQVDKREQIAEQGAPSLTGSLAQYANRAAGSPLPRNVANAIGNPAQPITNLIRNAAVAGVNRLGGSADVTAYQAEKGVPYMAGDFGHARGWDDARINAAVTDAMTKNPRTPDGQALLGAYNSQQDVAGLKKVLPVQVNEESNGDPYYGTKKPFDKNAPVSHNPGGGPPGEANYYVNRAEWPSSQGFKIAENREMVAQSKSADPEVARAGKAALAGQNDTAYQHARYEAGQGGRDAGTGIPAHIAPDGTPEGYYVRSPEDSRYNTARADIAKGSPVTPDSVPFMDYNRAYLQNPDIAKMGTAKQQQSLSGEIQGNATRTGAGLPQDQRTAQIAKEQQLEQPIGTNPDGTPYTLGDFLRTPGNVLDLERQYAEAKRNGATKDQLAAISAKIEDAKVRASARSPIVADYLRGQDATRQTARTAPTAPTGDPKKDSLNIEIEPGFAVRDFLGQKGNLFDIQKEYANAKAAGADKATLAEILRREDAVLASDLKRHPEVRAYFDAIGQLKYAEGQTGSTSSSSRTTTSTRGSSSVRTPARSTSYRGSGSSGFRPSSAPRTSSPGFGAGQQSRNDFFAAYRDPSLTTADKAQLRRDPLVAKALDPNSRNGLTPDEFKTATQRIAEQLQHHASGTSAGAVNGYSVGGYPTRSGTGPGNGTTGGTGSRQTRPGYLSDADILAGRQSDISRQIAQGNIPQGLIESAQSAVAGAGSTARYQQDLSSRYGPTSIAQSAPATPTATRTSGTAAPKGYYYDKGGTLRKSKFN